MILVDTSVWVDHLRRGNKELISLLGRMEVFCHPFIVGELACGNLKNRIEILSLLQDLPTSTVAENDEVLALIESRKLMGHGIGWVDAHLLASAMISKCSFWTADRNLKTLSAAMRVLY